MFAPNVTAAPFIPYAQFLFLRKGNGDKKWALSYKALHPAVLAPSIHQPGGHWDFSCQDQVKFKHRTKAAGSAQPKALHPAASSPSQGKGAALAPLPQTRIPEGISPDLWRRVHPQQHPISSVIPGRSVWQHIYPQNQFQPPSTFLGKSYPSLGMQGLSTIHRWEKPLQEGIFSTFKLHIYSPPPITSPLQWVGEECTQQTPNFVFTL